MKSVGTAVSWPQRGTKASEPPESASGEDRDGGSEARDWPAGVRGYGVGKGAPAETRCRGWRRPGA